MSFWWVFIFLCSTQMISAVVNRDWTSIVENAVIGNWKEVLCTLVTYSKAEEFSDLCCRLGERLEKEVHDFNSALICYICAGNVEKMVACWWVHLLCLGAATWSQEVNVAFMYIVFSLSSFNSLTRGNVPWNYVKLVRYLVDEL